MIEYEFQNIKSQNIKVLIFATDTTDAIDQLFTTVRNINDYNINPIIKIQ